MLALRTVHGWGHEHALCIPSVAAPQMSAHHAGVVLHQTCTAAPEQHAAPSSPHVLNHLCSQCLSVPFLAASIAAHCEDTDALTCALTRAHDRQATATQGDVCGNMQH
jgi:hypothetical protein